MTLQAPDAITTIILSGMTNLEDQRPIEGQKCSVAIFNKSGNLAEYYRSVEWESDAEDWHKYSDEWLGGERSAPRMAAIEGFSIFWKPAPAPCDRP